MHCKALCNWATLQIKYFLHIEFPPIIRKYTGARYPIPNSIEANFEGMAIQVLQQSSDSQGNLGWQILQELECR